MFKYVVDEYCAARKGLLVKAFIDALTVGGPGTFSTVLYKSTKMANKYNKSA